MKAALRKLATIALPGFLLGQVTAQGIPAWGVVSYTGTLTTEQLAGPVESNLGGSELAPLSRNQLVITISNQDLGTLDAKEHATPNRAAPLDLATVEVWLVSSQQWIDQAWQAATQVRATYRSFSLTSETFDSNLVPQATKQEISDLLDEIPPLLEQWQVLSRDLIRQVSLDPTDPDLGYLGQLLEAQLATMNALASMLSDVLRNEFVDRSDFELTGDIAKLWQAISSMLVRQLQENSVPIFRNPL